MGSLSSREHAIAPGLLSAALLGCGTSQRTLINTTDESGEGVKDEKRLVEKVRMACPEVSSTLSRLGLIGLFCFFSVLRRKHDICWTESRFWKNDVPRKRTKLHVSLRAGMYPYCPVLLICINFLCRLLL